MKRLIAKRKLQRKCDICNKEIKKGEVFYKKRTVWEDWEDGGRIYGYNIYYCPKCLWRLKQHDKRWTEFIKNCKHPDSHREMEYIYIPNEAIKEPSHEICSLCRQTISN